MPSSAPPPDLDLLSSWQFDLPPELIASRPAARRDDSRLLIVRRSAEQIEHGRFRDLPQLLNQNDLLVFNNTRVIPARLFGRRAIVGTYWEGLFLSELPSGQWRVMCKRGGRLKPGETIHVGRAESDTRPVTKPSFDIVLNERLDDGTWLVHRTDPRPTLGLLDEYGSLPLPPYIGRNVADDDDRVRYQTSFASIPGAIAAPTAGLHFTPELLVDCRARGIQTAELTLHVGVGTFSPVRTERLSAHSMHPEWGQLPQATCSAIAAARAASARVVAVGTTSVRTLESAAVQHGRTLQPWQGETRLFIRPGFEFQAVDALLTNFHLPGSTLLALVAALAGYELVMDAYRQAIEQRYRFFSYGDAMLIL